VSLSYKADKTYFSNQFGAYQTYESWVVPISISGTITNTHANRYQIVFNFPSDNPRCRASIQRHDTGLRAPFSIGTRLANFSPTYQIYRFTSSETVITDTHYENGGETLVLNLIIQNFTGGTITLVTQQLDVILDFYDAPLV
jgi:hypothetical protein